MITIGSRLRLAVWASAIAVPLVAQAAMASTPARACHAPPLPPPGGHVVTVGTEAALQSAVSNVASNTTIVVQPGVYNLAAGGGTLYFRRPVTNVTLRGATDRCDDVVLVGAGMTIQGNTPHGIWVGGPIGLRVANLTVRDIYYHPIMLDPNFGTQRPHIYNVRLINAGQQFVKVSQMGTSPNPVAGSGVADGVVEYSIIEYETAKDPAGPGGPAYTNGVDILSGANWIVRHNVFRNIRAAPGFGLAGPAVLAWRATRGTIVEGNLFLNCQYGIALGLDAARIDDHAGGMVRNNFFHRRITQSGDVGITINNSAGTKVLHNTIVLNGTYPNAIEYRFAGTSGGVIRHNLSDAGVARRDGASGLVDGNVTTARASWFVDAVGGDLHLTPVAFGAIDQVPPSPDVPLDYDGSQRPLGPAADVGADEFDAAGAQLPPAVPENLRTL
jgi:hypothetical protein